MPPFVSASALVEQDDHLLVVFDPIRGEPILPGGHLKWREKPEAALTREVREETGLDIDPLEIVAVLSGPEWAGESGVVRIVFAGRVIGGSLASSGEGEAAWLPMSRVYTEMTRDAPVVRLWLERSTNGRSRVKGRADAPRRPEARSGPGADRG